MLIFFQGFLLSLSLIIAIGVQNAFVVKQVLLKNHIFVVSGFVLSVMFLMLAGIFGVGEFLTKNTIINLTIATLGILLIYIMGLFL